MFKIYSEHMFTYLIFVVDRGTQETFVMVYLFVVAFFFVIENNKLVTPKLETQKMTLTQHTTPIWNEWMFRYRVQETVWKHAELGIFNMKLFGWELSWRTFSALKICGYFHSKYCSNHPWLFSLKELSVKYVSCMVIDNSAYLSFNAVLSAFTMCKLVRAVQKMLRCDIYIGPFCC